MSCNSIENKISCLNRASNYQIILQLIQKNLVISSLNFLVPDLEYNFSFFFIPTKLLIHWIQGFPVFSHVILSKKCCYICHFLSESLKKTHILSKVSFKSQVKSVALTAFQFVVLENAPLCNQQKIESADVQCMGRFGHLKMLWSNSLFVLPRRKPTNEWKYFQKKNKCDTFYLAFEENFRQNMVSSMTQTKK